MSYFQNTDFVKAKPQIYKLLQLAENQKDTSRIAEYFLWLANLYQFFNTPDSSFYYHNKALDICILKRDTTAMSICYSNLGTETFNRGFYGLSENYLKKAVHLDSITDNKDQLALNLSLLGLVYGIQYIDDNTNNYFKENAINCTYKSLSLKGNDLSHFYTYYALTQFAMWRKQNDSCDYYYQKFREVASQSIYETMSISLDMDYMIYYKQYRKALDYLISKKSVFEMSKISMRFYYEKLNYVYELLGDYRNAHQANAKQFRLQREISDDNTTRAIANAEAEKAAAVERVKREESEKHFAAEAKQLLTLIISLSVGLLLVSIMVILIFRMLKIKRKANIELLQKNKLLDERNSEIETQKNIITEQWKEVENVNKQLISSITYAERIQRAAVSSQADVNEIFPQNFVYYRPRNIVSGDYYRAVRCGRFSVMITADCTGHGIPGAFLSMLGISSLKEFMSKESDAENPGTVLDRMRNFIKTTLVSTSSNSIDDGMDMTICCFDFEDMELHYAIANQTMVMIRSGKITRLKGDKMPVGRYILEKEHFQTMKLTIEKDDVFYMFSDGIEDQFGGEIINNTGSKLMLRNLETFLLKISSEPIENQKQLLHEKKEKWRGNLPQVDDMTMVGIRV
ncbi:MAG: SpoIIE family protein phosphatase [Bacteroidales bacterium]|nr:SpoIIE family protein phosphatase [Bacteroidales bacterium]